MRNLFVDLWTDNFTYALKKVSNSADHFKERATKLMTAVSPSEYSAALTDIINYLEWQILLNFGILVTIILAELLRALMHQSQI